MLPSIYDYTNYKEYIKDAVATYPKAGRGLRKDLARALNCQLPYISHVLNGDYHFSTEQSFDLANYFKMNPDETEFFLNLVSYNRSSHRPLNTFLQERLKKKKQKSTDLSKVVKIQHEFSIEDQAIYYSHWAYATIHMLLTIPEKINEDEIAKRLRLNSDQVKNVLKFLIDKGLVSQSKGALRAENFFIHLGKDSPLLNQHHRNFRLLASESAFQGDKQNMHYSSAVTCSKADFLKIRKILESALENSIARVKSSKEEVLAVLNFDWFVF